MNVNLPENLYKFLPLKPDFSEEIQVNGAKRFKNGFDALEDILVKNKIYYSRPKYFNDPFEFDGVILKISQYDQDRKSAYDLLHRLGYISFSKHNDRILMWSHYADAHRGVCLRFKCVDDPFYSENGAGRVVDVNYGDDIIEKNILRDSNSAFSKMSRKARCWSYENEFRTFKVPSSVKADDASGSHNFNSKLVDAVYFGLKTGKEEIQKVKAIVESAKHKIELYQAAKNRTHLKIDFVKIN